MARVIETVRLPTAQSTTASKLLRKRLAVLLTPHPKRVNTLPSPRATTVPPRDMSSEVSEFRGAVAANGQQVTKFVTAKVLKALVKAPVT